MASLKKISILCVFLSATVLFAELEDLNITSSFAEDDELILQEDVPSEVVTATRSDIRVIEASEDIVYISQKMVKDYLFLFVNPKNISIKNGLEDSLLKLNDNLKIIARTTKNSDTKDLLEYLAYSKDEIAEILNQKMGEEQNSLMLDYSETLLEGANSMVNAHQYDFTEEEKMLMITKKIEYLLSRITKYYMAKNLGFNSVENNEQMKSSIISLEENIAKINLYDYPKDIEVLRFEMNKSWKSNKVFFTKTEALFIPNLMISAIDHLENIVAKLALYHSKNQ